MSPNKEHGEESDVSEEAWSEGGESLPPLPPPEDLYDQAEEAGTEEWAEYAQDHAEAAETLQANIGAASTADGDARHDQHGAESPSSLLADNIRGKFMDSVVEESFDGDEDVEYGEDADELLPPLPDYESEGEMSDEAAEDAGNRGNGPEPLSPPSDLGDEEATDGIVIDKVTEEMTIYEGGGGGDKTYEAVIEEAMDDGGKGGREAMTQETDDVKGSVIQTQAQQLEENAQVPQGELEFEAEVREEEKTAASQAAELNDRALEATVAEEEATTEDAGTGPIAEEREQSDMKDEEDEQQGSSTGERSSSEEEEEEEEQSVSASATSAPRSHKGSTRIRDALFMAAQSGDLPRLLDLVGDGSRRALADPNATDPHNWTPIIYASQNGHLSVVEALLAAGALADPDDDIGDGQYEGVWTALLLAASNGHADIVRVLVESGQADVDRASPQGATPLMMACQFGHLQCVMALLEHGADVAARDDRGSTAIILAARNGQVDCMRAIIAAASKASRDSSNNDATARDSGSVIDEGNDDGMSALMYASYYGHVAVVECLLNQAIVTADQLNTQNPDGMTALMMAVQHGHTDVVEALLAKGADARIVGRYDRVTALHLAAASSSPQSARIVEMLLTTAGSRVDEPDGCGRIPLGIAALLGDGGKTALLLRNTAVPNYQTPPNNYTPLHLAVMSGNADAVQVLLADERVDVHVRDTKDDLDALLLASSVGNLAAVRMLLSSGRIRDVNRRGFSFDLQLTSLHLAAKHNHPQVIDALLAAKARIDLVDGEGWTALMIAANEGHQEAVRVLLDHNASVNIADKKRRTALIQATYHNHLSVMQQLLADYCVRVDEAGPLGMTALLLAVQRGFLDACRLLIAHKADTYRLTKAGRNVFHIAAKEGHMDVLQYLLDGDDAGGPAELPSINAVTGDGDSALHLAVAAGHLQAAQMLLEHGARTDIRNSEGLTAAEVAEIAGNAEAMQLLHEDSIWDIFSFLWCC